MTDRDRLIDILICHWFDGMTMGQCADMLLANGVIVPPCKVGDKVYVLINGKVEKTKIFSMIAETEDNHWIYILKCNVFLGVSMFKKFIFGKTVFLTKEEAEEKLKELGK